MAAQVEPIRIVRGQVSVADLVVKTKADHARALATVEALMGHERTAQEDALLDVLVDLIEQFESRARPDLGHDPTPVETIRYLMEQNGLSQKNLWDLLGGKSHTSEILRGKRKVSNRQAALLGKRFNIAPSVFVRFA